jgi:hypothetical protein
MQKAMTLLWIISGLALWLAIVMIVTHANAADAPRNDRPVISPDGRYTGAFVDRSTAIEGCVEEMAELRATGEIPPDFRRQASQLRDIKRQLQKEKFGNWRDLMWGAAIKICMQEKGYYSTCVTKRGRDGDLQFIETAKAPSCWDLSEAESQGEDRVGATTPQPPQPPSPPLPPPGPTVPAMSPADIQQFNEDMSIISQPVRIIGDDEGGAKEARFGSCFSYWQSLSYNRSPEARHVLYAVRVARCMYRTNYAILRSRCPWDWNSMLSARCYARF